MDKRNKKAERPKLRKEDIGNPVNFQHVQHVGFGQKAPPTSTQSACASPSFENMDSFFNQENFRRSAKFNPGKENRFSNPSALPPYSSMSNLSIMGSSYEKDVASGSAPLKFAGLKKSAKSSFSGSLLNLNFFPFSKSSSVNVQEKSIRGGSKSEHNSSSTRSKRLSLGVGFPMSSSSSGGQPISFMTTRPLTGPPQTPSPSSDTYDDVLSSGQQRPQIRRRSSSFNGESDAVGYAEIVGSPNSHPLVHPSLTLNRHVGMSNKKQKMGSQPPSLPSSPPPLSPNYEELPPPPDFGTQIVNDSKNEVSPLPPESPSYVELPPPPMKEIFPLRKMSLEFTYPPPPPPPNARRKLSENAASPNGDMPPPLSPPPSPLPPPLPTSPPPSLTLNKGNKPRVGYNMAPLRAKLIRVNAPTLPPLSVPLIRPKSQSPNGTPSVWPLEPGFPELYQSPDAGLDVEQESFKQSEDHIDAFASENIQNSSSEDMNLSVERIQKACNHNSTSIDSSHIEPLSKLFQCRLSHTDWPTMMTKLFENSSNARKEVLKDKEFGQVYNELIQNTLELWLRLQGGQSTLESVVTAFEQTQSEISQDCNEHVTKL